MEIQTVPGRSAGRGWELSTIVFTIKINNIQGDLTNKLAETETQLRMQDGDVDSARQISSLWMEIFDDSFYDTNVNNIQGDLTN